MISVFKADSMIQRDALLSALHSQGIQAISPRRDLSRKVTSTTADISYEGYSSFFDGFDIQVPDPDAEKAQEIVTKFLRETNIVLSGETSPANHLQRFYFCSLFSLMVPIVFHGMAVYYLVLGLKTGEKLSVGKTILSVGVLFCGGLAAYYLATDIFLK